ncbi:CHAT domain-containing protein [Brachybacterium paraconglomeratum]|nr:CHAT domain-containing protein [Brachybacterium paraconglomeratum]
MPSIAVWNCADEELPRADNEMQSLESCRSSEVDVVVAGHALEWDGLGGFIASFKPTIFHFIGHGTPRGELVINEGRSNVARSIASVLEVVRAASPALEGVYLSGCHTSVPGPEPLEFLAPTSGWVVGTSDAVEDDVATMFTQKFYNHLFTPDADVREAFRVAKAYVEADLGDATPHSMWMALSSMPPVDSMAQAVFTSLRGVFDRGAMQVSMRNEFSFAELDHALQDMSHALGTGQVLSRVNRAPIEPASFPAEWLYEPRIADFVSKARAGISAVRRNLDVVRQGAGDQDRVFGNVLNFDGSASPAEWMRRVNKIDAARNRIVKAANELLAGSGAPPLRKIPPSFTEQAIERAARSGR